MRVIEDRCCDCAVGAYPCIGNACPLKNAEVVYCDKCGNEFEEDCIIPVHGNDYCETCFNKIFEEGEEQ